MFCSFRFMLLFFLLFVFRVFFDFLFLVRSLLLHFRLLFFSSSLCLRFRLLFLAHTRFLYFLDWFCNLRRLGDIIFNSIAVILILQVVLEQIENALRKFFSTVDIVHLLR